MPPRKKKASKKSRSGKDDSSKIVKSFEKYKQLLDYKRILKKKVILTLTEGKNREIRRLFESIDLKVARLRRIAVGSLELGDLEPGQSRELTAEELKSILQPTR